MCELTRYVTDWREPTLGQGQDRFTPQCNLLRNVKCFAGCITQHKYNVSMHVGLIVGWEWNVESAAQFNSTEVVAYLNDIMSSVSI